MTPRCKYCELTLEEHEGLKCLFEPTLWEPMSDQERLSWEIRNKALFTTHQVQGVGIANISAVVKMEKPLTFLEMSFVTLPADKESK